MIKYIKNGNIFDSQMQTLVNPVNCVGVMGKGLALEFKKKYPRMYQYYVTRCNNGMIRTGKLSTVFERDKVILLFPTKQHWRNVSHYEYIQDGMIDFLSHYRDLGVKSIAFPKLGSGLGGLEWDKVKDIMEHYLSKIDIEVEIYE